MRTNTRSLTLSALFIALGILVPQVFHLFGGTGPVFLPMHIPVLLAGFIIGGRYAAITGFAAVILSSLLTGMPQPPVLYFMLVEVTVYGFAAGLFYRKMKLNAFISLILAMLTGRAALAITVFSLQPLLGLKLSPAVYMTGAIINGIPGIAIQLLLIPFLVLSLEKAGVHFSERKAG
ncbi:ECF transporter S component [Youngiibacter fragilis]|uniref:Membrane protein n=1 Tax=Youngiibacter fragilis 232.1 TaxID=994573 RepID=V7I7J6_9CLOT|nr:ECF transporter S component [Youngiibacter fragilis]ETA81853.1 membrane protein [Youngiibacter fragilis 232.1]